MVTKKFKHKDNNGTVTEYDIGALAANVLHSDGQTAEQKGAALGEHISNTEIHVTATEKAEIGSITAHTTNGAIHIPNGGENGDILTQKNVYNQAFVAADWYYVPSETTLYLSNCGDNLPADEEMVGGIIKIDGYDDITIESAMGYDTSVNVYGNDLLKQNGVAVSDDTTGVNAKVLLKSDNIAPQWSAPESNNDIVRLSSYTKVSLELDKIHFADYKVDSTNTEFVLPTISDDKFHEIRVLYHATGSQVTFTSPHTIKWKDGTAPSNFATDDIYEFVFRSYGALGSSYYWFANATKYFY